MKLEKSGNPLLNTEEGAMSWVMGLFCILFIMVFAMFELQLAAYKATSDKLEDALTSSGLAAALIDIETYGINHELVIKDTNRAYEIYEETIRTNLGVEDMSLSFTNLISGPVEIESFNIYNVSENVVTELILSGGSVVEENTGVLGEMKAPNGQVVERTGVYGEISFPVKAFLGVETTARKSKLVEVNSIYS